MGTWTFIIIWYLHVNLSQGSHKALTNHFSRCQNMYNIWSIYSPAEKVRGSPIPIKVQIFKSGPKWWTEQSTLPSFAPCCWKNVFLESSPIIQTGLGSTSVHHSLSLVSCTHFCFLHCLGYLGLFHLLFIVLFWRVTIGGTHYTSVNNRL